MGGGTRLKNDAAKGEPQNILRALSDACVMASAMQSSSVLASTE